MGKSYEEMDSNAEKGWGRLNGSQFAESYHKPTSRWDVVDAIVRSRPRPEPSHSSKPASNGDTENPKGGKGNDLGAYAPFKKNERFDGPPGAGNYTST